MIPSIDSPLWQTLKVPETTRKSIIQRRWCCVAVVWSVTGLVAMGMAFCDYFGGGPRAVSTCFL